MLQTFEILDRFELLYPLNSKIADLRRAYIDKDLSSIFRLMPGTVQGNAEDLRKAVMDQNLHSIFRLFDNDDLRKLVMEDNVWKLWPVLTSYTDTQFVAALKSLFVNEIEFDNDCFSRGQLYSKLWLVNELKKLNLDLGTVFLCAGWYGTLATMIFESGIKVGNIRSFDIDPSCAKIAEIFNKPWFIDDWKFKSITEDIMDIDYSSYNWSCWSNKNNRMSKTIVDTPDTVINTSCEHIENFNEWYNKIPKGTTVILQSNNYFEIEEHVNCSATIEEFDVLTPMSETYSLAELPLDKYTRYTKIGLK